jgi:hypothetical protein
MRTTERWRKMKINRLRYMKCMIDAELRRRLTKAGRLRQDADMTAQFRRAESRQSRKPT